MKKLKSLKNRNTYEMAKKKLTLSIDEDIILQAKKSGVNISQLVENFLKYGAQNLGAPGAIDLSSNLSRPTTKLCNSEQHRADLNLVIEIK